MRVPFRPLLSKVKRAIVPPRQVPAATEDRLLFRFGYLIHPATEPPSGDALWQRISRNWGTTRFGDLTIRNHPELRVAVSISGTTALLGDAFFSAGDLSRDPLTELAGASGDAFLVVLDELSGRFLVLAARDGTTSAYHDAYGARSVFYRDRGGFGLGSHPELFSHSFGDRRSPEMADFVGSAWFREMSPAYLPTDATLFDSVIALLPNHRYNITCQRPERYWPRQPRQSGTTFDQLFEAFDLYFRALAGFVRDRRPVVAITGGIDSRTIIAALRHHGTGFRTVNWDTFNIKDWEREPVRAVARHLAGDHSYVDKRNDSINDEAIIGARNSGNYRQPSGAVAGMARLFGHIPKAIFLPGFGSGMIRGAPPHEDMKTFTPAELLERLTRKPRPAPFEHRAFVLREFDAMIKRGEFDQPISLGYDPTSIYHWEHQAGTWAVCSINAMHAALDAMFGFNTRVVAEVALGLPDDVRRSKKLFLDVIRRYDPALAAIPFQ